MTRSILVLLLAAAVAFGSARAAEVLFCFVNFEEADGWPLGDLPERSAFVVRQGTARVIPSVDEVGQRVLELPASQAFAAIELGLGPLEAAPELFCELLVRPPALGGDRDSELLDFGGAILGFFRNGEFGEIRALSGLKDRDSVWITTGTRIAIDSNGQAAEWLRILVRRDRRTGRWDVSVNGGEFLRGLQLVQPPEAGDLALWLFGDTARPTFVDDVLISTVSPDFLESALAGRSANARSASSQETGARLVTNRKPSDTLRRSAPELAERPSRKVSPELLGWRLRLETGATTIDRPMTESREGGTIIAYAPGFDDEGRRLPLKLTITADAALQPGVDLSRLRWRVVELIGWPDKTGEAAASGDFGSGLVQEVTLEPRWTKKALSVQLDVVGGP